MTAPSPFIQLTNMRDATKKDPTGEPMDVRRDAITTIRSYPDGTPRGVYAIVCIKEYGFMHVAETRDQVLAMIS